MTDEAFWADAWLDGVASGAATMSQRAMTTVDAKGGIAPVVAAAKARGVHLLKLTDDQGKVLIAASQHPFEVLC